MTMNAGTPAAEAVGSAGATTSEGQSPLESTDTEELQQDPPEGSEADSKEQSDELTDEDLKALEEGDDLEVEHQGKKLKVPKDLKPLVMMQQDYTRKTQELAEGRRAIEARETRNAELVQAATKTMKERAQLSAIDMRIDELQQTDAEYDKVDWTALLSSQNPEDRQKYDWLRHQRDQLHRQMRQLIGGRQGLAAQIDKTEQEQIAAHRTEFDKRRTAALEVIKRDIPGWGPEREQQMIAGAQEFYGLSVEDLRPASTNAGYIKALHDGVQLRTLLKAKAAKPKPPVRPADSIEPEPAAKVTRAGPSGQSGLHDKLPIDEWMRRARAMEDRKRK